MNLDINPAAGSESSEDCAVQESPEYLRMSLAAAMTLGFKGGLFYRDAKLYCINLLLTYSEGCSARCAYCGLSKKREGAYEDKSFIRVTWPTYSLDDIIEAIGKRTDHVKRVCISQVTNKRSIGDTKEIAAKLRAAFDIPVSLLISPTIVTKEDLQDFKAAGADKIGVAVDAATPEIFDKHRGKGVGGPHSWDRYFECLEQAIEIFGVRNAGSHLVTGLGETERDMIQTIQRVQDMGGWTHLFSFLPEQDSQLSDHPVPDMDHYRRIQLGRWLIDEKMTNADKMQFDDEGRVVSFGVSAEALDKAVDSGEPFRTSGCEGYDGEVACNRPYANSRPGPNLRNYPFKPNANDTARIRQQLGMPGPEPMDDDDYLDMLKEKEQA
jgi:biotin synthase